MLARNLLLWGIVLLFLPSIFATQADVDVHIGDKSALFTYTFEFTAEDNFKTFSFEKPQNAIVHTLIAPEELEIEYSFAGDFLIIKSSKQLANNNITLSLSSQSVSEKYQKQGVFSEYTSLNIPLTELSYVLKTTDNAQNFITVTPREYEILSDGSISWKISNVDQDILFLLDKEIESQPFVWGPWVLALAIIIGIIIILSIIFGIIYFKNKKQTPLKEQTTTKKEKPEEAPKESQEEATQTEEDSQETVEQEEEEDKLENFLEKYLTANEQSVVRIVLEEEGIKQFDILHHLPTLSKSNLSKIITKLHGKRILQRVKVGKVNSIYIGEKLKILQKKPSNSSASDNV